MCHLSKKDVSQFSKDGRPQSQGGLAKHTFLRIYFTDLKSEIRKNKGTDSNLTTFLRSIFKRIQITMCVILWERPIFKSNEIKLKERITVLHNYKFLLICSFFFFQPLLLPTRPPHSEVSDMRGLSYYFIHICVY